jgi:hypothetical protein
VWVRKRLHWSYSILIVGAAYAVVLVLIRYVLNIPRGEMRTCAIFTGVILALVLALQLLPVFEKPFGILREFLLSLNRWARVPPVIAWLYFLCLGSLVFTWNRSYSVCDSLVFSMDQTRRVVIGSYLGTITLAYSEGFWLFRSSRIQLHSTRDNWFRTQSKTIVGLRRLNRNGVNSFSLWIGYPVLLLFFVIPGAVRIFRGYRYCKGLYPHGACAKCAYDLTGNVSGICPECGTAIGESSRLPEDFENVSSGTADCGREGQRRELKQIRPNGP